MTREEMLRNLENVYELYKDRPVHTFEINIASMIKDVMSFINENTIEPIDRSTGHWIKNDNGTFSCSNCQSWIPEEQYHYARYCLYCGAKMESDEK